MILEELQTFGGNTLANTVRGAGIFYKEILCDVADKLKVKYDKSANVENIEKAILLNSFNESLKNLSENDLREIVKDFSIDISTYTIESISNAIAKTDNLRLLYQIAMLVVKAIANKVAINTAIFTTSSLIAGGLIGSGAVSGALGSAATFLGSRVAGTLAGPIGMIISSIWMIIDIAGPAFRVTVPAVIYIAFLRRQFLYEKEIIKQMEIEQQKKVKNLNQGKKYSLDELFNQELNILIVGGTGAGKSSTIKALFETEDYNLDIEINSSSKPVTQEIKEYQLSNLTIYDSPGLGDGSENDSRHMEKIKNLLEKNDDGKAKIDLVLVIVNATTRDLESTYKTINEAIMPYMEEKERILIALNKCDKASDNPDITFDYKENKLSQELEEILEEKVKAIKERIKADTEIDVDVIYYAAGYYNEDTKEKRPAYNLNKLLAYIVDKAPLKKRLVFLKYQSKNKNDFKYDDNKENYAEKTKKSWLETIKECVNNIVDFSIEAKNFFTSEKGKKIVEIVEDLIAFLRKTK
ncbi:TPA: GTPase [Campylobacter jejuni]|uniref:GTPase n=1 Tax=Campylobacter jejuni TaxID=197 RepID=UPI002043BF29|nr:GTPase [Campylobacter jejuni]MEA8964471.1 50S ribosome-binding GTPase [Campylobacter jejuni]MEA8973295.1 50S ribosome-binding GTPase [Campylobacter jejuni]